MDQSSKEHALYSQAQYALAQGDLKQAASLCQQLMDGFPESAQAYHLMSSLFRATGNFQKAYDYASLASRMDDCVMQYHMQQGEVLEAMQATDQAMECFKRAQALAGRDPAPFLAMARCLMQVERFDEAREQLNQAREFAVGADIFSAEAECLIGMGECAEAEQLLLKSARLFPCAAIYQQLCDLSLCQKDFTHAEHFCLLALQHDPDYVPALRQKALIRAHMGDDVQAVQLLLSALALSPTDQTSLLLLGNIFVAMKESNAAEKALLHVLHLSPDHLLAWQGLLAIKQSQGALEQGLAMLHARLEHSAKSAPLRHLAALYRGDLLPLPPRSYVETIYNQMMQHFAVWRQATKDDQPMQALVEHLCACDELADKSHLSLLDLGCNTGRLARALESRTAIRVGVDVSQEVLRIARRSKCYDVLYDLGAEEYVLSCETTFDVVTSVGALRWMGNVQPLFHAVRNAMHSHSLFAFIVAREPSSLAYSLLPEGRYQHNPTYICDVAVAEGLQLVQQKELWWHDAEQGAMHRHLFILKKTTLH